MVAVAVAAVATVAAVAAVALLLLLLLFFSNRRHVRARPTLWFEKTKPGELKNKRAYQMLIWKIFSR